MCYGLPLKGEGDEKCLHILNSVEETLSRQLRACKAPVAKKKLSEGIHLFYENGTHFKFYQIHLSMNFFCIESVL